MGNPNPQTTKNLWPTEHINSVEKAFDILSELQGIKWICRGQPKEYGKLLAPIDRPPFLELDRKQKLFLEQQSMQLFRSSMKYFNEGEFECRYFNVPTLMLMQHHLIPTRLLDWSASPYVAAFFACNEFNTETDLADGEIWCFDYDQYYSTAEKEWVGIEETHKKHKNIDSPEFDEEMPVIFTDDGPEILWIMLDFLHIRLPRLSDQKGFFSVVSKFGFDHALALQDLLEDKKYFKRLILHKNIKNQILEKLHCDFEIWQGSLFPDSSGVAEAVNKYVYNRLTKREDTFSKKKINP
jgi:hypothetical protein